MITSPVVLNDLREIALAHAPHEAVGLVTRDGRIITLTNLAEDTKTGFKFSRRELLDKLDETIAIGDSTLWHTHPGGGVGPSRTDMQQKTPFKYHLVVTLIDGDIKLTYY